MNTLRPLTRLNAQRQYLQDEDVGLEDGALGNLVPPRMPHQMARTHQGKPPRDRLSTQRPDGDVREGPAPLYRWWLPEEHVGAIEGERQSHRKDVGLRAEAKEQINPAGIVATPPIRNGAHARKEIVRHMPATQ